MEKTYSITKEAIKVKNVLINYGIENSTLKEKKKLVSNTLKKKKIAKYINKIMLILNLNLMSSDLSKTPDKVAEMYIEEIFSGLDYINFPKISYINNINKINEIIIIKNIFFISTCEHHFVVFDGKVTVAYIPKKRILGLSKIIRIVQFFSRRPQIQERLTKQIFLTLQTLLQTKDVAIIIHASHFCVKIKENTESNNVTTISLGGLFKCDLNYKKEFLKKSKFYE